MSTREDEIRRRIAAQDRRRRQSLRGDPLLRPAPDTPATRVPTRPVAGIPREGAMRPRSEPGVVTGAGGIPDPFKGGAKRPNPEPGLVTGSANRRPMEAGLRNALDAAGPNRRSPPSGPPNESEALRNALDAAGPNRRSPPSGPSDEAAALQNALDAGRAGQRATTQKQQVRDGRPATLRDGDLTPDQTRAFPAQEDSSAPRPSGGGTVDDFLERDLGGGEINVPPGAGGSASAQTNPSAPRPSASGQNPNAAGARGPNDPGRFEAVRGLSPAQQGLDSAEVRARRAAGETNPIGSAELAARTGGNPNGLRQGQSGSATFNIPQGARVLSSSPGAMVNRVEPGTGRIIETGPDGIERYQSRVLGGPLRERGGLRSNNAGPINTRLSSGRGANGEPVFDNASIRRGIEQDIIPDPVADSERAARNLALDEARRPQTLRNLVQSGAITQEQFDTETAARTAREKAVADVAAAQARSRRGDASSDRSRPTAKGSLIAMGEVANSFRPPESEPIPDGRVRLFAAEAEKAIANGDLPADIQPEDLGMLLEFSTRLPELGSGIFRSAPNEPIGPETAFALAKRAALNPGQDKIQVGGSTLNTSKLDGLTASAFEASVNRLRTSFNQNTANELANNNFDPSKLDGENKQALKGAFEAPRRERIAALEAQKPQVSLSGPVAERRPQPISSSERVTQIDAQIDALKQEIDRGPDADFALQFAIENAAPELRAQLEERL